MFSFDVQSLYDSYHSIASPSRKGFSENAMKRHIEKVHLFNGNVFQRISLC